MTELERIEEFNEIGGYVKKRRSLSDKEIISQLSFITEEYKELEKAFQEEDLVEVLDACADLIVTAAGMIHRLGFSVEDVVKEVNDSNMSKFCFSEEDAVESVKAYSNDPRYENVYAKAVKPSLYVIKGDVVGGEGKDKILKSLHYKKPNLKEIVGEQHA